MGHLYAAVIPREDRRGRRVRVWGEAQSGAAGNRALQFTLVSLVDADGDKPAHAWGKNTNTDASRGISRAIQSRKGPDYAA